MVKYKCSLKPRSYFGKPKGLCDNCVREDCTNPIHEVIVEQGYGLSGFPPRQFKEIVWCDSNKTKEEWNIAYYYCVMDCKGFKGKNDEK